MYAIRQALIDAGQDQASGNRLAHPLTEPDSNPENLGWAGSTADPDPVTDLAVTAVSAPNSVVLGDVVSVDVTVENVGNQDVTGNFTVSLDDDTDNVLIGTADVTTDLAPGDTVILNFSWDTTEQPREWTTP